MAAMGFWRDISPWRAAKDFTSVWKGENPYRWRVLAVSVALTAGFMILLIPKSERIPPRPPVVTYITSFAPDRSDEEIVASNLANQKRQDELRALLAQREELRRKLYRDLGEATGLDVDEMEREIARDKADEEARREEEMRAFRERRSQVDGDTVGE